MTSPSPFPVIEEKLVLCLIEQLALNRKKLEEAEKNISPYKLTLNQICFLNIREKSLKRQTWNDLKNNLPINIINDIFINCMFKIFIERIQKILGVYGKDHEKILWFNMNFSCMNLKFAFDIYDFLCISNYNILE